ncbi:ferredoxin [Actinomadura craniellae]|uniref:Ferredoxin n=1 Tax=Actinomadura craniellae TaxID=2231787 RepID=A0A365HAF2_9ACTN|nr:ferredoxin [Actinomadura craniellae]RAY16124.1 ferredoxin [Actinomadura craniellae]
MKIEVDWDRCEGYGMCEETAPHLFRVDDNGDLHVEPNLPPDSLPVVRAAVRACPMAALKLT